MKRTGIIIGVLALAVAANAKVVTWDGSEGDNRWDNPANWDAGSVPASGDEVFISNGDAVIGIEFNEAFTLTLSGGSDLLDPTTSFAGGAWRASGATVIVGSGSTVGSGAFWDLRNATFTFEDGAAAEMGFWEQKDVNVFNFNLSAGGFAAMTPGMFMIGNGGLTGNISNATYNVDMANYTGGEGVITLVDFDSDGASMDNTIFQGAGGLNVNNAGSYAGSYLQWNDTKEAIELHVIPEPATLGLVCGVGGLVVFVRRIFII